MADNRTHLSVPIKGMNTDVHPSNLTEQGYDYALNCVVEDFSGNGFPILQNESSTLKCTNFPSGYRVVDVVNIIEQDRKILFLTNTSTGFSQIGEILGKSECGESLVDSDTSLGYCSECGDGYSPEKTPLENQNPTQCCEYVPIATQTCFNFDIDHPVRAVYRLEDCGISVYFGDNFNYNRYIEFEYIDDDPSKHLKIKDKFKVITGYTVDCLAPIYGSQIDCNKMRIDPVATVPNLNLIDIVGGGSLKAGAYQFLFAYADKDGNKRSPYLNITNPVPIFTREVTFDTDYQTDRAITFEVSGVDANSPYEYFNIAVVKTINNVSSFEYVSTYPIGTTRFTYTGNEKSLRRLDANDIFEQKVYYSKSRGTATSNNFLFWYSPEETKKLNIQRIANNVKVYWATTQVPESAYRDPRNAYLYKTYMRDEVYPLGLVLEFDNQEESAVGHIPNREATEDDVEIVENADVIKETNCDDCGEGSSDEQVIASELNEEVFVPDNDLPELNEDNSNQEEECEYTPYSDTPTSPNDTGSGTVPIVNAGPDQSINYDGIISLNGTEIHTGAYVTALWKQISGPNQITIANPTNLNTYFDGYITGTYVIQLVITENTGNVGVDSCTITVNIGTNAAPIADPGPDKIVVLPTNTSYLNGGLSSDDRIISAYLWTQDSGPTATLATPTSPYTDVSGLVAGTYVFRLRVTDDKDCYSEATTIIYVLDNPCDSPPDPVNLLYPVNGSITSSFATVILDWEDAPCATSYDVYLAPDGDPYVLIGNSTSSTFTATSLDANTVYNWYVVPKNAAGSATDADLYYRTFVTPTESSVTGCDRQKWEVYNTASVTGTPHQPYKDCEETCWEYGEFAYWESIEKYPNNPEIWGDLCGQPIRFHKFPDSLVTHIHDGLNVSVDNKRDNMIYPIGIKVDHDSVRAAIDQALTDGIITLEDKNRIKGYKIVRGNRFGNKSIVAKGLLYDVNQYRRKRGGDYFDNDVIYYSNYPYNDLNPNPFVTDDFRNYDEHNEERGSDLPFIFSKRYTFHSPDTHFSEPFIGTKLKLETAEYGTSEGYFTISKRQAKQKFLSNASYVIAFALGIVAALTKTEEKEIKEYTVKGTVVSGMGVAAGVFGPYLPYPSGTGAAILPESILDTIVNPTKAASIGAATEVRTQTIQGKQKDWSNPAYLALRKPLLLPLLPILLTNYIAGFLSTVLYESGVVLDLIKSLTPYRDWCIQYNSVGKYNSYKPVPNTGNKIRGINSWRYLKGENGIVPETSELDPTKFVSTKINNWHREESLYLRYAGTDFPDASTFSIQDNSRFTFEDSTVNETLDKRVIKNISSYYASIKNYRPDQYGNIFNVEYISTGSHVFNMTASNSDCKTIYGGDTFINRFALKRKAAYFLADTFEMQNGTDFDFSAVPNLGVPRHYYDSTVGIASQFDSISDVLSLVTPNGIGNFLGRPKSIRDGATNKFFYQNGYIYLYHYGIPYFLVESDVNVDFRYAENLSDKAFYPLQQDLDFWLQEENVRLREPNYYFYNNTYSKQNKEHSYIVYPASFEPGRACRVNHPNGIIYSDGANWLRYKANDFFPVPLSNGRLISVDGIENDKVLIRCENTFQVFNAYITIPTNTQSIQVGTGGMFSTKPQEYAKTTLGYGGSQHMSILHTEFGHIWPDAKRGQVLNLSGGGLDEISKYGMKNWFKENLPFQISKDFPEIQADDLDNNYKGIGITMAFDKRFSRLLITKLDYKVLDSSVIYDAEEKVFKKDDEVVSLQDKKYFCDKSWTVSFSFLTKAWTSFHSYKPNYYIDSVDYFTSGLNLTDASLWDHNLTNKSYQVFYGKVYPWSIQTVTKYDISKNHLNSVEYSMDAIRYHNEYDAFYNNQVTFNKAIVSNQSQSSGLLELEYNTKKDLNHLSSYPRVNPKSTTIRVTNSDGVWRFNQFYDLAASRSNNIPLWLNNCANTEKTPNPLAINYQTPDLDKKRIRGEWNKVMLTNDKHTNYKMIFKWLQNNSVKTYR